MLFFVCFELFEEACYVPYYALKEIFRSMESFFQMLPEVNTSFFLLKLFLPMRTEHF